MSYVGSAIDLTQRLRDYFYLSFIKKEVAFLHVPTKNNSRIYRALLKKAWLFKFQYLNYRVLL